MSSLENGKQNWSSPMSVLTKKLFKKTKNLIFDFCPSKSKVIGRCGGGEQTEWSHRTDKRRAIRYTQFSFKSFSNDSLASVSLGAVGWFFIYLCWDVLSQLGCLPHPYIDYVDLQNENNTRTQKLELFRN